MAVEVRIPTILRAYTQGEKAVQGDGATRAQVIDDIDGRNPGIKERLVESENLRRFVNVYVNDEDVRFTGGLSAARSLIEPVGLRSSSLAHSRTPSAGERRGSPTSGVWPTESARES